jgi:hypothetical protein
MSLKFTVPRRRFLRLPGELSLSNFHKIRANSVFRNHESSILRKMANIATFSLNIAECQGVTLNVVRRNINIKISKIAVP